MSDIGNAVLDSSWDEVVWRLAVGLRLVDAVRDGRPITDVQVAVEDVPRPHKITPAGPMGVDFGIGLPEMKTRRSGRFALLYPLAKADRTHIPVRVFHRGRRFVPRRLLLPVRPLGDVVDEDDASRQPPYHRVDPRGHVVALFPGSAYEVSGTTGVRSRLETAAGEPVRWARVWATAPNNEREEGVAHTDDRGEFVLLLRSTNALLGSPPSLTRNLVLHAVIPPPTAESPGDPALDPLSSLPVETLPDPGQPDDVSGGENQPPDYTAAGTTLAVTSRMGRVVDAPPFTV